MQHDGFSISNASASATFSLMGGVYAMTVAATFGGGSVKLQKFAGDGTTLVDLKMAVDNAGTEQDDVVGTFVANGDKVFMLSAGAYQFTVTTATAVYATIARCPAN